jgi:hypothetical protein
VNNEGRKSLLRCQPVTHNGGGGAQGTRWGFARGPWPVGWLVMIAVRWRGARWRGRDTWTTTPNGQTRRRPDARGGDWDWMVAHVSCFSTLHRAHHWPPKVQMVGCLIVLHQEGMDCVNYETQQMNVWWICRALSWSIRFVPFPFYNRSVELASARASIQKRGTPPGAQRMVFAPRSRREKRALRTRHDATSRACSRIRTDGAAAQGQVMNCPLVWLHRPGRGAA